MLLLPEVEAVKQLCSFWVSGIPGTKKPARTFRVGRKCPTCGKAPGTRTVKTEDTRHYQDVVGWSARAVYRGAPSKARIELRLTIHDEMGRRADVSNILKAIEDGMNKVVYDDDSQIDIVEIIRLPGGGSLLGVQVEVAEYLEVTEP
jgi:Holliday junction resolvase RusA-like endonuclease